MKMELAQVSKTKCQIYNQTISQMTWNGVKLCPTVTSPNVETTTNPTRQHKKVLSLYLLTLNETPLRKPHYNYNQMVYNRDGNYLSTKQ
jgi:hypothetical protein